MGTEGLERSYYCAGDNETHPITFKLRVIIFAKKVAISRKR